MAHVSLAGLAWNDRLRPLVALVKEAAFTRSAP
jgi:hypothetical protein